MQKQRFLNCFFKLAFFVIILPVLLLAMGGTSNEPKLFTSQPSYSIKVIFQDDSQKDLKSLHFNGKPELPNVFLVCRGLESANNIKTMMKKRKTSIKAKIEFKNIKKIIFGKFSDTHIKAFVTAKDGTQEEYRIPSDTLLKAESDISIVELDLKRIKEIVFVGMSTKRNTISIEEKELINKKLFSPANPKSVNKLKTDADKTGAINATIDAANSEPILVPTT